MGWGPNFGAISRPWNWGGPRAWGGFWGGPSFGVRVPILGRGPNFGVGVPNLGRGPSFGGVPGVLWGSRGSPPSPPAPRCPWLARGRGQQEWEWPSGRGCADWTRLRTGRGFGRTMFGEGRGGGTRRDTREGSKDTGGGDGDTGEGTGTPGRGRGVAGRARGRGGQRSRRVPSSCPQGLGMGSWICPAPAVSVRRGWEWDSKRDPGGFIPPRLHLREEGGGGKCDWERQKGSGMGMGTGPCWIHRAPAASLSDSGGWECGSDPAGSIL